MVDDCTETGVHSKSSFVVECRSSMDVGKRQYERCLKFYPRGPSGGDKQEEGLYHDKPRVEGLD